MDAAGLGALPAEVREPAATGSGGNGVGLDRNHTDVNRSAAARTVIEPKSATEYPRNLA